MPCSSDCFLWCTSPFVCDTGPILGSPAGPVISGGVEFYAGLPYPDHDNISTIHFIIPSPYCRYVPATAQPLHLPLPPSVSHVNTVPATTQPLPLRLACSHCSHVSALMLAHISPSPYYLTTTATPRRLSTSTHPSVSLHCTMYATSRPQCAYSSTALPTRLSPLT
jgi:hypothetical protein